MDAKYRHHSQRSAQLLGDISGGTSLSAKTGVPHFDNSPEETWFAEQSVGRTVASLRLHRALVELNKSRTDATLVEIVEADKSLQTVVGLEYSPS
ncbi:hypothetical protein PQR08_35130 [Caballeronia jiangsuensis]|uniref:Uncharacterized protein n=1 Tax=Caballeronia jiangsuensis TaxID=1458357 RepID=A0ABW9CX82_9BURK